MPLNLLKKKPKIFYLHIPKTGGTSIHAAIQKHYTRQSYNVDAVQTKIMANVIYKAVPCVDKGTYLLRDGFVMDAMRRNIPYISGHTHFNLAIWERYGQEYSYITVLRDPVRRYISACFFNANKEPGEHSHNPYSLSELIKNPRGTRLGHFYLNYLSGYPLKKDYDFRNLSDRIEIAKANLLKLDLVGILEDMDDFKARFREKFGLTLKIPHKNKNPVSRPTVEPEIMDRIREICQPDIEIYEFAKSQMRTLSDLKSKIGVGSRSSNGQL